jgi:hypothetical protein
MVPSGDDLSRSAARCQSYLTEISPSRTTSVTTATRLAVILEKSIQALRMGEAIGW